MTIETKVPANGSVTLQNNPMERRSQRVELTEPLAALFGETPVTILELSDQGAMMEHPHPLPIRSSERIRIATRQPIELTAVIRHSVMVPGPAGGPPSYRSGVAFTGVSEDVAAVLEGILLDQASRLVRLWEANAQGHTASPALLSLHSISERRAPAAYIWMRLVDGAWQRATTLDPNQPLDGFAVPATEAPRQLALLCDSYERGSQDERNHIRALAQLAIAESILNRRSS